MVVQKDKVVSPSKSKKKLSSAKNIDKESSKKQETVQQTTGPTTTNLTLNMNFNMQQSSIQMHQGKQENSARQQYRGTETDETNQDQSSHRKYDSSAMERSPSKKKQHKKNKSSNADRAEQQLRELTKQESTPQVGTQSASPSKVKKVKVPKSMIDKAQGRGTNTQSQHQFVIQELSTNPLQQQLQLQQQQQLNANPMSPNHHGQQLPFNYRLRVAQIEKETSKNSTATQLNVQSTRRGQVQDQFSNGSNSRLGEQDAKLNRKNERPTVAQILDLNQAESQWTDALDSVPRRKGHRSIQPKSQVVSAGQESTQPVLSRNIVQSNVQSAQFFNATSNFEQMQNYLGTMTQPQTVKQNKMKGASQLFLQENISLQHRSPNSQQTKLLNPLKNRQFGVQSEVYASNFDPRLVSPESHRNSQLRTNAPQGRTQQQSTFANQQGRTLHGNNSNAAAHAFLQSQGQFQDQQQYLAPYYIDYSGLSPHARFNQQLRDTNNIQLPPADYSRHNRMQSTNEEQYHQVGGGDFPLISVTSSQLASLISQAASNRQIMDQRQQIQERNLQQQTKQTLQQPISPQATFRYDGGRISNPLSLTIQINERDRQQFHTESGQQVNNQGIFLPSLQQQMNTTLQQTNTNNFGRQINQNIASQQQIITAPAPVTKMRLCSRGGKSVPRGSARTDPEPLIERQNTYRNKANYNYQQPTGQSKTSRQKQQIPYNMMDGAETSSIGNGPNFQGEIDNSMLDVNDLTSLMVQQNLRQNNQGQDLLINTQNDISGQSSRRRLPAQFNNAKMRMKQPSSTTVGAGNSQFEASQQQITSSRTAQRQEGSSKNAQYVKQTGPLSDLIMTSQTNLAPTQPRIVMKGRNKSQVNVIEVQGPNSVQREQEQSNSQIPVQSSLDDDGGVPYESKVATAMAMQNLQNFEALAQTDQVYSQHLQINHQKLEHDRNPSGSSAGETGEQFIGVGRDELDPSMLGSSPGGQPLTNFQIVEAHQQAPQQVQITKKNKGSMGVGSKVIHNRPSKQKNSPQQNQVQEQRLTQSQAQATFGKRQQSQAPPVLSHMMHVQEQQIESRNMAVVQGLESVQYSQVVQAPAPTQQVLTSAQIRKQQFERKTTLGPRALPSTFNVQTGQQNQEMNRSQREIAAKANAQNASTAGLVQTPASKSVPPTMAKQASAQPAGEEPSLSAFGMVHKQLGASCLKYYKKKNISQMTGRRYRDGFSTRLLVAKETFHPKRAKLPVMILNLDGGLGYWDEAKTYVFKERNLGHLMTLSHNFRIVAYSAEPKSLIRRLGSLMAEYSRPFCFDAVYQITKKQHQPRVNISHILLDFQDEDEEDMDLFASSSVVMVTADKQVLNQRFETMDLREILDFDKDYMTGNKAPLIIRVPHARLRANNSFAFDGVFQILVSLLVSSRLKNFETPSFFSYNDRTRHLSLPTKEPCMCAVLLPDKLKFIDKSIIASKSNRFVMGECPYGFHVHKGFKRLTEAFGLNGPKLEWLEFQMRNFKPLLPVKQRLQKITQQTLQNAVPPTGKRLIVRCLTEEANRRYQNFSKKNENVRKHIRKYRGRYWAVNQIEEPNLEEEQADVVGELAESRKPMEAQKIEKKEDSEPTAGIEETKTAIEGSPENTGEAENQVSPEADAEVDPDAGAALESHGSDDGVPSSPQKLKELENAGCSSGEGDDVELSSESEDEQYEENAQPIKYKVIDIKLQDTEQNYYKKMTMVKGGYDPHKPLKFECRKTKCKAQALIDLCSKKQNTMMFQTNQAQHLVGAQAQQIENQIAELVQKLHDAEKAGKREVVNYDF